MRGMQKAYKKDAHFLVENVAIRIESDFFKKYNFFQISLSLYYLYRKYVRDAKSLSKKTLDS